MFIDKVYTFVEIGELAYKHNVLTNKQGLEIIQRRGKQQKEVSPELIPGAMKGAKKPGITLSELVSEAHDTAATFRAQHQSLGNPPIPHSSQGLQQLVGTFTSDEVLMFLTKVMKLQSQQLRLTMLLLATCHLSKVLETRMHRYIFFTVYRFFAKWLLIKISKYVKIHKNVCKCPNLPNIPFFCPPPPPL